jgi:hypothetical protein
MNWLHSGGTVVLVVPEVLVPVVVLLVSAQVPIAEQSFAESTTQPPAARARARKATQASTECTARVRIARNLKQLARDRHAPPQRYTK